MKATGVTMSRLRILFFLLLLGGLSTLSGAESGHGPTRAYPEPHGEQLCASGCALSRHPTPPLTRERYRELRRDYLEKGSQEALDELLYFGPQTRLKLETDRDLRPSARLERLQRELKRERVLVSFRLIDSEGVERVKMPPMNVPLDLRHVFEPLQAQGVQPPEASGTVKRVGLGHIWQRI